MDNFITNSDFIGDKFIPFGDNDITLLDNTIAVYQKKILLKLLGWDLYLAFESGLDEGSPLDKWTFLQEGDPSAYEVDYNGVNRSVLYEGMEEMITYFVWFYYMRDLARKTAASSKVFPKNENSVTVVGDVEMVRAYDKGLELYGLDWANIQSQTEFNVKDLNLVRNRGCNPNYKDANLNNKALKILSNVYNYIYFKNDSDSTTYPNWVFTRLRDINTFGI